MAKKSEFQVLKDNRKPLSAAERDAVMKAKAVWHHGPKGEETTAVWKSEKGGKTVYVTNTHRAYQTAPTVKGAVGKFHKTIKGTA